MIRKDREKKEYAKEQTWIEKLDPAERDSHAAGQGPAQTSRDLSNSWQEGKPRMPEREPAHISKDLFSGWKEGKPRMPEQEPAHISRDLFSSWKEGNFHMPEQKPAHISRDLFCDWQEGKLKTPEETDFFTHIGACTFCAEQFANWMEEGILDEGELALGPELLDISEFAPGPEPLDIPELAQGPGPLDIPEFGLKNRQQAGTALDGKFCSQGGEGALWKEPPRYLKEEILTRTRQLDVKAAVKLKETSRQVQLMVYSLKVGFAVVASIFLLTITADIQNMNPELIGNQQPGQAVELQGNQTSGQEQGMEESQPSGQKQGMGESQTSGQAQGLPENQKVGQAEGRKDGGDIVSRLRQGSKEITGLLNELSNGLFRIE